VFGAVQNIPNPFNPSTSIEFDVPERSPVRIVIYDAGGRTIRRLLGRSWSQVDIGFSGRTGPDRRPGWVWELFCRIECGRRSVTIKMTMVR